MIQQSINQLLTLGAVGAKFSQSEKMKEVERLKEQAELQTGLTTQEKLETSNAIMDSYGALEDEKKEEQEQIIAQGEQSLTRKKICDTKFKQTIPDLNRQAKFNKRYISQQMYKEQQARRIRLHFNEPLNDVPPEAQVYDPVFGGEPVGFSNIFTPEDAKQSLQQKGMQQFAQNVIFGKWADDLRARKQISHSAYEQIKEAIKNDERKMMKGSEIIG